MKHATVLNIKNEFQKEMTATEFERDYLGTKEAENLIAVSPYDATPLSLRKSYSYKLGAKQIPVSACWVRPKGSGDHDHVFARNNTSQNTGLKDALKNEKSVILALDFDLFARPVSFKGLREHGAQSIDNWIGKHHGQYISIPIHSAQDAVKAINRIHDLNPSKSLNETIFAAHGEAVIPYRNFYLGNREHAMKVLFESLQHGHSGVAIGKTRMQSFPRLIHFVPTLTTLEEPEGDEEKLKVLRGNYHKAAKGKPHYSQLIFENKDNALETDPYKILHGQITGRKNVYVLASASVTVAPPEEREDQHKMLRWNIRNIERQTTPMTKEGKARIEASHAEHIKKNELSIE